MAITKVQFKPGIRREGTSFAEEGHWYDCDKIRFRNGYPEKIGGWQQLGQDKLTGAARAIHHWDDNAGIKYAAVGTNRILYVYSGGVYYDIHPLTNPSGTAITSAFSTTNGSPTVTLTFGGSHNFQPQDIILFGDATTFSAITNSNFVAADFADKKVLLKGCGQYPVPDSAYVQAAMHLSLSAQKLMYGEACSNVLIHLNKK